MKTVIVGGVAAGASTGARLRRLDDSAEIVILERGHYVSFANCGLPYHIGGEIPDRESLLLQTPESLAKSLALDVRTGQEVVRIDRDAKVVEVRDLAQDQIYRESYDTLVLCTGAEPMRPPIPGADDPGVDVLRDIADMDRILARLDNGATSAVVVGGSYIGLELTEAFRARGLSTTVIERTDQLMPWLDPEMTRILDYHVGTHEVDLRLGTSATAVRHSEHARLVLELSDGTTVEGDIVVMAAGARPQVRSGPRRRARDRSTRGDRGGCPHAHLGTRHSCRRRCGRDRALPHRRTDALDAGRAGEPRRAHRRRHDRRPPQPVPRHPGNGRGQSLRHDRGRHRPDRDRAAGLRHRLPQSPHTPERPRRLLPRHRSAVPQGPLRTHRRQAPGGTGARLGRCRQAHRRPGRRGACRHDHLRPRAPRAGLRTAVRCGQGPAQHGRVPGARTCCAATSTSGTPRTTPTAPRP